MIFIQWIKLEGVEHGELHVRFAWYELTSSSYDLPAVHNIVHMKVFTLNKK